MRVFTDIGHWNTADEEYCSCDTLTKLYEEFFLFKRIHIDHEILILDKESNLNDVSPPSSPSLPPSQAPYHFVSHR